jgi:hypothetical protein
MSPLVKTKRQTNLKDFKRFGAFKRLVEQKNVVLNSFLSKLGFFGTRQINYYIVTLSIIITVYSSFFFHVMLKPSN